MGATGQCFDCRAGPDGHFRCGLSGRREGLLGLDGLSGSAAEETPEIAFDRSWAWSVLDAALSGLAVDYEGRGETAIFEALRDHLLASRRSSQAELAASLGCGTEEIRRHLRRARSDLRAQLLGQLVDTIEDSADLDGEVQEFLGFFGPARPDLTERK